MCKHYQSQSEKDDHKKQKHGSSKQKWVQGLEAFQWGVYSSTIFMDLSKPREYLHI